MKKKRTIKRKENEISIAKPIVNAMLKPNEPTLGEAVSRLSGFELKTLFAVAAATYEMFVNLLKTEYYARMFAEYFGELPETKLAQYNAQRIAVDEHRGIAVVEPVFRIFMPSSAINKALFLNANHAVNAERKQALINALTKIEDVKYSIPYCVRSNRFHLSERLLIFRDCGHECFDIQIGDAFLYGLYYTAETKAYQLPASLLIDSSKASREREIAIAWIARNYENIMNGRTVNFFDTVDFIATLYETSQTKSNAKRRFISAIRSHIMKINPDLKIDEKKYNIYLSGT